MGFVEYVSLLHNEGKRKNKKRPPPWGWIARQVAELLNRYPTGLTDAIIKQEVQQQVYINHMRAR